MGAELREIPCSEEDEIGPAWSEPYGCCYGECDTPMSVAFREYHGIEEAFQEEYWWAQWQQRQDAKAWRAKVRNTKPRKQFCELLSVLCSDRLTSRHRLPKRLRFQYFGKNQQGAKP